MTRAICGVFHLGAAPPAANSETVDAMLAALPGRGRAGRADGDAVSFGWRELWADGAEGGAAHRAARGLAVVADARLDNREELAGALGVPVPAGDGADDSELILRAYDRWGGDCPLRLHGDYAFAVWDPARHQLFCARDAVGARPFFHCAGPGRRFAFASDVDAALAQPGVKDDLDEAHVAAFLMGRPTGIDSTFFRAVRSLPPGHCITVGAGAGAGRARRWWRPEDAPAVRRGSDEDYEREFLEHVRRAVRDQLRGGHPLGAHLSGGLDSSCVTVLAARELRSSGRRLHAFCWQPPPENPPHGEQSAEHRLIESVCAREGPRALYHTVSTEHALAMLRQDVTRFSDRDGTLTHETLVQRSAAQLGVRVILSGWGGDEAASHSGSGYHAELLREGRLGRLLREARGSSDRPLRFLAMQAVLPQLHVRAPELATALLRGEMPRPRRSFAQPALVRKHRKRREPVRVTGVRRTQLALLRAGHLAQRMEDWTASGARAGVEYRYPLLDRRLLEFVLGLPGEQFRRGPSSRRIMRRALRSVLPPTVLEHSEKTDPARARPRRTAMDEAVPTILRRLDARAEPPARAGYLDMDRLRAHLEARLDGKRGRPGKLARALRFLDWDSG